MIAFFALFLEYNIFYCQVCNLYFKSSTKLTVLKYKTANHSHSRENVK